MRVVDVGDDLDQLLARRLRPSARSGVVDLLGRGRVLFLSPVKMSCFMATRSTTPWNSILGADRESAAAPACAPSRVFICVDHVAAVGADAIHLVDERDARHVELVGLVPHRLRLRLDAVDGAEDHHRAVEHAQRALDLDGEVDVAGRVDEVQLVALPAEGRRRGGDGDAALALLGHPVHLRVAFVDLADLVDAARVEEKALGDRGLAGVDVRDDAEVANLVELRCLCHEPGCFSIDPRPDD